MYPIPNISEIELTNLCNANCVTCPRFRIPERGYMSMDTINKISERLNETKIKKIKYCGLGEPTLHPHFNKFTKKLSRKFDLFLNTNGINLTPNFVDKNISYFDNIILSVPSLKKDIYEKLVGVNSFEIVKRNLDYLINSSKSTEIILYVVLNKININFKDDFKRYSKYNHVKVKFSGTCNRAISGFLENLIDFEINKKYNCYKTPTPGGYCKYSLNQIVIDWEGKYLFCASDISKKYILGNIWDDKVKNIHKKKIDIFQKGGVFDLCKNCNTYKKKGGKSN